MDENQDKLEVLREHAFFSIVNGEIFAWEVFQKALQENGVPVGVGRFIPLHCLVAGPMRLQELTELTHAKPSAASRLIERMVKDGLIEKQRDGCDGRAVLLQLTPEGQRVEAAGRAVFAGCLSELFCGLSPAEIDALSSLLSRIGAFGAKGDA